ncbi:hypothetical protein VTL71DRAFT_13474 [Oculimacula yallundae]|uniref:Methyltransferase domain-containing protein n=1 Tax=Oculimacula yallundae TaxID=86028 RepID=A0ABR4CMH4_9HELO
MSSDIKSKNQAFYLHLSERPPTAAFRRLLADYSKIPEDEVNKHLETVRDDAWNHYPYPSIGLFVWLDLGLSGDDLPKDSAEITSTIAAAYKTIIQKLQNGGKFLDVGCMFAQDTRKLVQDGAPASSVFGTDLHEEYFEYGYKLFRDEKIIPKDHFIAADILDEKDQGLKVLEGNLDVINATHLIHVFSLEDQRLLIRRFIKLLKQEKGVMVTGRMTGHLEAGYHAGANVKSTTKSGGDIWEHSPDSFKQLWHEVGEETGTKWDVQCWFWRFGIHTGLGKKDWYRKPEHGICTFIITKL